MKTKQPPATGAVKVYLSRTRCQAPCTRIHCAAGEHQQGPLPAGCIPGYTTAMLEHLLDPEFADLDDLDVGTLLGAQARTVSLDAYPEALSAIHRENVQAAFSTVTNPDCTVRDKRDSILSLRVPQEVRHLAGMLSEYDWDFVEQAKQLRGYVVAKLLEETKHADARIRLRALELVGRLTEVASFSDRIEIIKKDATSSELEERIRARLAKMLPPVQEVETLTPRPEGA